MTDQPEKLDYPDPQDSQQTRLAEQPLHYPQQDLSGQLNAFNYERSQGIDYASRFHIRPQDLKEEFTDAKLLKAINLHLQHLMKPRDYQDFHMTVANGMITLSGTVASPALRQNIEAAIRAVRGVQVVQNDLQSSS